MHQADRSKLVPYVEYVDKELMFLSEYEKEVDWKVYELQRSKRLEIERWVESLINATLDICKILLTTMGDAIPDTSREILFKIGSRIYENEEEAEALSELAKIRNTLAHRYLDLRWSDIKRFLQLAPKLYPPLIDFVRGELGVEHEF